MAYETILVETRGKVGLITLNRPKALNALNTAMMNEVVAALGAFDDNPRIGSIVITGSEKAFAAGADIKEMSEQSYIDMYTQDFFAGWDGMVRTRKPIIAAVAGYALGGGCELAMMCDFIIAAETAKFGQPEITLGVMPGMGGSQRLTRFIGKAKAMDMCLTGRMMDAEEAERQQHGRDHRVRQEAHDTLGPVDLGGVHRRAGELQLREQRVQVRGVLRVADADCLRRRQREQLAPLDHALDLDLRVDHGLGHARIEATRLRQRAHLRPHRTDDLLRRRLTFARHRRRGADHRTGPHVHTLRRQRDHGAGRVRVHVDQRIYGQVRVADRLGDPLRRVDPAARRVDVQDQCGRSGSFRFPDAPLDERGQSHLDDARDGHAPDRGTVCGGLPRRERGGDQRRPGRKADHGECGEQQTASHTFTVP